MKKKVLVIGGLGFIGYHISEVMSRNGLKVTIAHRSPSSAQESQYDLLHLVLDTISKEDLRKVLMDFSYIIFCGGADDRKLPTGDALAFYYKENVVPCRKLVEAGNYSKVEKLIILGSYLTHFDRSVPEWKLKEKHPYIMSRYLQQVEPIDLAEGTLQVSIIEIPYVFGIAPGKVPLWKPLIDYISKSPIVIYTKGGTNIMSVEQLATAVYGVVNTEIYKQYWIVGSENVTWSMLIKMISAALRKRRKVLLLPNFVTTAIGSLVKAYLRLTKKQTGLDPNHYIEVQTCNTFLDIEESMNALSYDKTDMQKSIDATVEASGYALKST